MQKIYISGGKSKQSVEGPLGQRWTKNELRPKLAKYGFDLQKAPNHETTLVVVPDGVARPSKTTRSKILPGTRVMEFGEFAERLLLSGSRGRSARKSGSRSPSSRSPSSSSRKQRSSAKRSGSKKANKDKKKKKERGGVCASALQENIRRMMREWKDEGRWSSQQQALAVAFSKTKKEHPRCKL